MTNSARTPWYVWAIAALLAASPVAVHYGLDAIDNERAVFSGLSTADSAIFLAAMEMPANGFYSPYATCESAWGDHSARFLAAPLHVLYFIAGAVGRALNLDPFLWLGWLNGAGMAVYLIAVYRFLRNATPGYANAAFVLFTLSGGIGGFVLFGSVVTNAISDELVFRTAVYEVVEGAFLFAPSHAHRLYYTLALACGFGFLSAWLTARRIGCSRHAVFAGMLLFACGLLQPRLGFFFWSAGCCWLLIDASTSLRRRMHESVAMLIPIAAVACIYLAWTQWSPTFYSNASALVRETIWPVPLFCAAGLHLLLAGWMIHTRRNELSTVARIAVYAAAGYLVVFLPLYAAYKLWYGNFWSGGESAAAAAVSDVALLGLLAGVVVAARMGKTGKRDTFAEEPFLLWGIGALIVGLSAWGQGWFMDFAPQRLMLVLGVPVCVAAAMGLARLKESRSGFSGACWVVLLVLGVTSLGANVLFVQGAVERSPGGAPFAEWRRSIIAPADAQLLEALSGGTVLTPLPFADVVARNADNAVLGGTGATDLSDVLSFELQPAINRFFGRYMAPEERLGFLERWCVEWIVVPTSWPVADSTLHELDTLTGLTRAAEFGQGVIYRVETTQASEPDTRALAPNAP